MTSHAAAADAAAAVTRVCTIAAQHSMLAQPVCLIKPLLTQYAKCALSLQQLDTWLQQWNSKTTLG